MDITPLSTHVPTRVPATPGDRAREAQNDAPAVRRGADRVEFSAVATYLSKLRDLPIRQDVVDRVRAEIAAGTYDTPEKLDAAVNELLADIG